VAEIDTEKCIRCGKCVAACRFDAMIVTTPIADPDPVNIAGEIDIIHEKCEGCGVCGLVCPVGAISLVDRVDGELYTSETRFGPMSHAAIHAGGEASGKLVAEVRNRARLLAQEREKSLIISDGPPGIGCPVISAISGTDLAVVITEPTISGIGDMERVLETTAHFKVPAGVIVNKSDVNPGKCREIRAFCAAQDIPVFGELPYDMVATESMVAEQSVTEYSDGEFAASIKEIWNVIGTWVGAENSSS